MLHDELEFDAAIVSCVMDEQMNLGNKTSNQMADSLLVNINVKLPQSQRAVAILGYFVFSGMRAYKNFTQSRFQRCVCTFWNFSKNR